MELRVWQSFSCNNSGSYYLVARFGNPEKAKASADELTNFFAAHAVQVDEMWDSDGDPTETPTAASLELAEKHGFEWEGYLLWGDEGAEGDEPRVAAAGNEVVIHHAYCGGFGEAVPEYFKAVGATTDEEADGTPVLSVILTLPDGDAGQTVSGELDAFFHQTFPEDDDYPEEWSVSAPWGDECANMVYEDSGELGYFNDGETIGFSMPFNLAGFPGLIEYFDKHGVTRFHTALEERGDKDRFRTIAAASCPECKNDKVRFLEAAAHEAPADQLACTSCGGMFPLSDFSAPSDNDDDDE